MKTLNVTENVCMVKMKATYYIIHQFSVKEHNEACWGLTVNTEASVIPLKKKKSNFPIKLHKVYLKLLMHS